MNKGTNSGTGDASNNFRNDSQSYDKSTDLNEQGEKGGRAKGTGIGNESVGDEGIAADRSEE